MFQCVPCGCTTSIQSLIVHHGCVSAGTMKVRDCTCVNSLKVHSGHVSARAMEVLLAFSLLSNGQRLISTSQSPEDIHCVHGIRALNAFMLLMSHKSMALFFNPFVNRTAMTEVMSSVLGSTWDFFSIAPSRYISDRFFMDKK
jgi:hypothetical protein